MNTPSHLPPHNISLGHPHAPAPSKLHPTSDMDWRFNSYMTVYMLEFPFSCLQSFPTSRSFQMSQFFTSGGQSIGDSASASVLPINIQERFPSGLTGWISLLSKGFSRVPSNTTVQKHQFFSDQLSL